MDLSPRPDELGLNQLTFHVCRNAVSSITVSLSDTFHCTAERAFAAPIRGDATRFLGGYRFQPPISGFEDDATWGQPGGVRYPVTEGGFLLRSGRLLTDTVLERVEGERWTWEISEFTSPSLFFIDRAPGQWRILNATDGAVEVAYSYEYFPTRRLYTPLLRAFVALQVRGMLRQALREIKAFAESDAEMCYP